MDNDSIKAILTYIGIIFLIIVAFKLLIPLLFSLIGFIITLVMKLLMWGLIIYVLYLLVKYLYENYSQK